MKIWLKRYFILTICFVMALLPTFSIIQKYGVLDNEKTKFIFILVLLVVSILYYGIMTYFILRKKA